jgi:cation:H+ antiporter
VRVIRFEDFPLWNLVVFAAAVAVWLAGTRLSRYAAVISERTGVGKAFIRVLLTGVYVVGLLERRKRVVPGMGMDSLLVLLLYGGGTFLLYTLR